mmetsp:Transcript_14997/g.36884  ORF Transcript_14997/g.36884 Transcript_14997/m.36884 type:complete len:583 (+) Transcript_14997:269-2017(+)
MTTRLKTKEELLVTDLGQIEPLYDEFDGDMYAGMIPSGHDERRGEMMFWMFEPKTQLVPDTMVIWLNGGPGCSSWNCGVMMEHSPVTQPLRPAGYCCLSSKPDLVVNENSWTKYTTMLYPEQPIGTGFSYGNYPKDETDVAADLYQFMQNFYKVFDHLTNHKLFVMGESYAGMYLPSIGRYFHLRNEDLKNGVELANFGNNPTHINLGGVGIGNGWMNGFVQGPATIDYSWWHGLIDEPTRNSLHNVFHECVAMWRGEKSIDIPGPFHPFNVQDDCGIMWGILQAAGNPNAYDITTWDPNVDQITFTSEEFFNREDVRLALHAPLNITWHGCADGNGRRRRRLEKTNLRTFLQHLQSRSSSKKDGEVLSDALTGDDQHRRKLYMENDRPVDVVPYVADLVNADIPVLVYNGDRDMTTNSAGSELLLNGMDWKSKSEWLDASRGVWMSQNVKGGEGGWAKEYGSLKFVVVYNSGHMVPYNQPIAALDLLRRFLTNESFVDVKTPQIRYGDYSVGDKYIMSNPIIQPPNGFDPTSTVTLTSLMAFVAGIVCTIIFLKFWDKKQQGIGGKYSRIPDADTSGNRRS